jgi:putative transposase
MHFTAGGQEYEILKRLPSGEIQIKDIVTNECSAKPEEEIIVALFRGEVELLGDNRNQVALNELLKKTGVSDLTLLKDDDPRREEMARRRDYVLEIDRQRLSKFTEESLKPIIEKVGQARGDIESTKCRKRIEKEKVKAQIRPSVSTLIRWWNRYIKSGKDERSFVPATRSRGNRERKFSGSPRSSNELQGMSEIEKLRRKAIAKRNAEIIGEIIDETIDVVYLNKQRFSVQDVYDAVVVKIDEENEMRSSDNQLPMPHKSSIYDVVNKLDDYEITATRYSEKIAEEKYKLSRRGPRPTMPLERVEGDHAKLNLFAIDPIMMLPIGRPILTWLVCVYTKMILGFYISFNPYGSLPMMECLKHAIRPKSYVREKYPDISHTWGPYGVMKHLVLDNAPEFWGRHLEDACRQFGINIQYGQKGCAWYRPTVERAFGSYNTGLIHRQPGTTFSNIIELADYDPKKNALITLDTLDHVTHKFIIDYLQFRPHRGIEDIPALRWEKGIEQWPPSLPAKARDLDIILGYLEHRQINPYGIEIDSIIYNDEDLVMLRRQMRSGEKNKVKHIVKRNPSDLSLIHVYDEKHDRYLPVPAIDQEYTTGLSLYQHKVIRKYVRERLNRDVDIVGLCRAKVEIQEIVERDWSRAKSPRTKIARWRNEGIQKRREGIESTDNDWLTQALSLPVPEIPTMLLLSEDAAGSREGMSDFHSILESNEGSSDKKKVGDDVAIGFIERVPTRRKTKEKAVRLKAKSAENIPQTQPSQKRDKDIEEQTLVKIADLRQDVGLPSDDELDMTGWTANYDIPT